MVVYTYSYTRTDPPSPLVLVTKWEKCYLSKLFACVFVQFFFCCGSLWINKEIMFEFRWRTVGRREESEREACFAGCKAEALYWPRHSFSVFGKQFPDVLLKILKQTERWRKRWNNPVHLGCLTRSLIFHVWLGWWSVLELDYVKVFIVHV